MDVSSRITLKDVAARAGVSYQTVSKVLNKQAQVAPETEARIWEAVAELNYQPNISARNLRTQASKLLGYGWSHPPGRSTHPVLDRFLHSAAHAAERYGYHLLTFILGDDDNANMSAYNDLYARRQVDGFILASTVQDDPRIARLIEQQVPFVSFGQANSSWEFCWVDVDGRYGIELTMSHLLEQGHRRIAFITWPEGSQSGYHREQGYLYSLQEAGIRANPAWIRRGEDVAQTGTQGLNELLALPEDERPTAVACVSDLIAIGAMNAAAAAGLLVGQDVAITGFDDVPMAEFLHPPLTSVRQPIAEVGQRIIDLLVAQINDEAVICSGTLLRPQLVVRESG
jgi:DNA-binding LacI/PurR family transcriptional regulator